MPRGQINMYLPPEHPIIVNCNNRNQNGRRICKTVYAHKHLNALIGEDEGSVALLHDPGREKQHTISVNREQSVDVATSKQI